MTQPSGIQGPPPVDPGSSSDPLPPSPTPKRRTALIASLAIAVLVLLGAVSTLGFLILHGQPTNTPAPKPSGFSVVGELILADSPGVLNLDNVHCQGMNGYSDINLGAEVTVTDQDGTVVALGRLDQGTLDGSGPTRQCKFGFTITGVPAGKAFYAISVGHRGSTHYTEQQLRDEAVYLSLG